MNNIKFPLLFVLISISNSVFPYSSLVFDRSQMELKDVILEKWCPSGIKGKGYCDPRFMERWKVNTGTTTDLDLKYFFNPDISFFDEQGKVVYRYNSTGVYYKGEKVCEVSGDYKIPYVGKKEQCPYFLDGPIRYTSSDISEVGGALVLLDDFDGTKGTVEFKGEKLFYTVNDSPGYPKGSGVELRSHKMYLQLKESHPTLKKYVLRNLEALKNGGVEELLMFQDIKFVINDRATPHENVIIQAERDKNKVEVKHIAEWYNKSPLFKKLLTECLDERMLLGDSFDRLKDPNYLKNEAGPRTGDIILYLNETLRAGEITLNCSYTRNYDNWKTKISIDTYPITGDCGSCDNLYYY